MSLIKVAAVYRQGRARTGVSSYAERLKKAVAGEVNIQFFSKPPETGFDLIHLIDVKSARIKDVMNKPVPVIADLHDYYWAEYRFFWSIDAPLRWLFQKSRKSRYQKILNSASAVIVHSRAVSRYVLNPKVFLVPIAIEYEKLYADPAQPREPVILLVGRDDWRKGLGTLISALRLVRKDFPGYEFRAEIIGDEYVHGKIMGKILSRGLNVKFISGMDFEQLIPRYQGSMIIYLGSWQEGFGLSLAEGMAGGCIGVGSNVGGIPEVIEDGRTGILFTPGEKLELAAKIQAVLENDEMRIEIARRGQRFVKDNLSLEKMREALLKAYEEVLKRG